MQENGGINIIKRSKFYLYLFILDIVLFFLMLLWVGSGDGYEFGAIAMIIVFPVIEIIFSIFIIIIYEIYRKIKITYPISNHGKIYKFSLFVIFLIGIVLFFLL
jgi:hypothetical protein